MPIGALIYTEFIKTTRRAAFWVTLGVYFALGMMVLFFTTGSEGVTVNGDPIRFSLPEGWTMLLDGFYRSFSVIFFPTILILLVAAEFTYKTARQNIIDGLSKEAFFASKLLLVLMLSAVFFLIYFLPVLLFGLATKTAPLEGESLPLIRSQEVLLFAAYFTLLYGYGSIALFFAFLIRSSGAALGVSLLYLLGVEGLVRWIMRLNETIKPITDYFPTKVFDELLKPLRFESDKAAELAQQIDAARKQVEVMRAESPDQARGLEMMIDQEAQKLPLLETPDAFIVAWLYILAIVGLTYFLYKRRDL